MEKELIKQLVEAGLYAEAEQLLKEAQAASAPDWVKKLEKGVDKETLTMHKHLVREIAVTMKSLERLMQMREVFPPGPDDKKLGDFKRWLVGYALPVPLVKVKKDDPLIINTCDGAHP